MEIRAQYLVKEEASIILPEYDQNGRLLSIVIEQDELFKVDMQPTELIDYSLRCYGSSLRGAYDGSRMLLGEIFMPPIVMNVHKNLFWFPSMSPTNEECVWLSIDHIKDYAPNSSTQTIIQMRNDSEFILDTSYYSVDQKIKRTHMLKHKIESRVLSGLVSEQKAPYVISKEAKDRNYRIE